MQGKSAFGRNSRSDVLGSEPNASDPAVNEAPVCWHYKLREADLDDGDVRRLEPINVSVHFQGGLDGTITAKAELGPKPPEPPEPPTLERIKDGIDWARRLEWIARVGRWLWENWPQFRGDESRDRPRGRTATSPAR